MAIEEKLEEKLQDSDESSLNAFLKASNDYKKELVEKGIKDHVWHRDPKNGIPHTVLYVWDENASEHKAYIIATTKDKPALHPSLYHEEAPHGSFGKVKSAFPFDTEEDLENILSDELSPYMTKTVFKKTGNSQKPRRTVSEESIKREIKIAENIYNCSIPVIEYENRSGDKKYIILMPRHHGMDLHDYIEANINQGPTFLELLLVAHACLEILYDFHQKGYIHVDIKPPNIIYDYERNVATLIDFGHALHIENPEEDFHMRGTLHYQSPELIAFNERHGDVIKLINHKTDIYSMGCVIKNIFRHHPHTYQDSFLASFIQDMLANDPEKRPTAEGALKRLNFEMALLVIRENLENPEFGKNCRFNETFAFHEEIECLIDTWKEFCAQHDNDQKIMTISAIKIWELIDTFHKRYYLNLSERFQKLFDESSKDANPKFIKQIQYLFDRFSKNTDLNLLKEIQILLNESAGNSDKNLVKEIQNSLDEFTKHPDLVYEIASIKCIQGLKSYMPHQEKIPQLAEALFREIQTLMDTLSISVLPQKSIKKTERPTLYDISAAKLALDELLKNTSLHTKNLVGIDPDESQYAEEIKSKIAELVIKSSQEFDKKFPEEFAKRKIFTPITKLRHLARQLIKEYNLWKENEQETRPEIEERIKLLETVFPIPDNATAILDELNDPKFDVLREQINSFKDRLSDLTEISHPTNAIVTQINQDIHGLHACKEATESLEMANIFLRNLSPSLGITLKNNQLLQFMNTPFSDQEKTATEKFIIMHESNYNTIDRTRASWFVGRLGIMTFSLQRTIKEEMRRLIEEHASKIKDLNDPALHIPFKKLSTPCRKIHILISELEDVIDNKLFCKPYQPKLIIQKIIQKIPTLIELGKKAALDFSALQTLKKQKQIAKGVAIKQKEAAMRLEASMQMQTWRKFDIALFSTVILIFSFYFFTTRQNTDIGIDDINSSGAFSLMLFASAIMMHAYFRTYPWYTKPRVVQAPQNLEVSYTPEELARLKINEELEGAPKDNDEKNDDPQRVGWAERAKASLMLGFASAQPDLRANEANESDQQGVSLYTSSLFTPAAATSTTNRQVRWGDQHGQFLITGPRESKEDAAEQAPRALKSCLRQQGT